MAEKSGGKESIWQCIHCHQTVPGIAAGFPVKFCFLCGKEQIFTCVNPDCNESFERATEVCSKCHTPQQQQELHVDAKTSHMQIMCINAECKEPLPSDKTDVCPKCKTSQHESKTVCISPLCKKTLESDQVDMCEHCGICQKQDPIQSAEDQLVCSNPNCTETLPDGESKVCSKCKGSQIFCINPKCKAELFTNKNEMCHVCHKPQTPATQTPVPQTSAPPTPASQTPVPPTSNTSAKKTNTTSEPGSQAGDSSSPVDSNVLISQSSISSVESSVDKSVSNLPESPELLPDQHDPAVANRDAESPPTLHQSSAKENEKKTNDPNSTATQDVKKDQTNTNVTISDELSKKHSQPELSSSKSSEVGVTESSSDADEFHTPPPSRDPLKGTTTDASLTRPSLEASKRRREEEEDSDELTSSKRRALDASSQMSSGASGTSRDDNSSKVKGQKGEVDEHKGSGQQAESSADGQAGSSVGGQAKGTDPVDKQPTEYKKKRYDEAQEESLVKGKGKDKKKKNKNTGPSSDNKDKESGASRPQTRSQTKKIDLTGLHPPPAKTLEVTFHALLPNEAWNWNETSRMCMRFGHPKLGEWNENVGNFLIKRDLGDGLFEMEYTLQIDSDLLKHKAPVSYKYLVCSEDSESKASPYEFLNGAPGGKGPVVNRKLEIETKVFKEKGQYHQFDSMVYPETKTKNILSRAWNFVVGQSSKGDSLFIPDHDSMQEKALEVYLDTYRKNLIECELSHHLDIVQIAEHVYHIFKQLHKQKISESRESEWKAEKLPLAMKNWLQSAAGELELIEIHSREDNGRRMASALAILVCLDKLIPSALALHKVEYSIMEVLFELLYPRPDCEKKTCHDIDFVFSLVPKDRRKMVHEALNSFCQELCHKRHLNSPHWLYALPLLHRLKDTQLKPFQKLQCKPEEIPWVDKSLGLGVVRHAHQDKNLGIVKKLFAALEPLMILDPFLLTAFVYVCPKPELCDLFERISSYFSTSWLIKDVKNNRFLLKSDIEEITKLTNVIISKQGSENQLSFQELIATIHASFWLFREFGQKVFKISEPYHRDAIKAIMSLFLSSASRLRHLVDCSSDLKSAFDHELDLALKWVYVEVSSLLIKGFDKSFGNCGRVFMEYSSKDELKLWNSLIEFDKVDVHKEVLARWHSDIVERIIKERLSAIQHGPLVRLFSILDSESGVHDLIINVFMDSVMQSIEHMNMKDAASSVTLLWNSSQKEAVGKIFDRILIRQYPKTDYISLDDLLNWDLWPNYIIIYRSEGMIEQRGKKYGQSCLPERSTILCGCAISTLDGVCESIVSGCIIVKELENISKKKDQMEKLCSAARSANLDKKGEEYDKFMMALESRLKEYRAFINRRNLLGNLCKGVTIDVTGLDDLMHELQQNYDSKQIRSLCVSQGPSQLINKCFNAAIPLDPIKVQYDFMARHHPNDLFHRVWDVALMKASRENTEIIIEDIVTKIWDPAFKECCRILESLNNRSMTLEEVNQRFRNYDDGNKIKVQLQKLHKGVELCLNRKPPSERPTWIDRAVERMQQYWTLSRYATAAQTILQLKEKLELTGDFSLMETIAKKMSSGMRDKPLEIIDQSLIDAGDFLGIVEEDQRKLNCLRVFADSLEVVEWIRNETKGLDDLHDFVSVALHTTAGESDFDSDRLSNLKTVGNGFGPLIFGLIKNKSFEAFRQGCLAVWEAMETAPDLPKKIHGCKSELAWYKSVKQSQGTIEETTFRQMDKILKYGCYVVGSQRPQMCHNIHDIVYLMLTERDEPLTKKQYSLNELRDLESKLALIVGKNAENRTEVGLFTQTLHNVCRIAEVLISLQQVGNVKYTGWKLHVPCGLAHVVPMLQDQAKEMEHELKTWEEEVTQKRGEFYELNYYTTLQLLSLRKELGVIKSKTHCGPADVTPTVLALLESISTRVSAPRVFATVQKVITDTMISEDVLSSNPTLATQSGAANVSPSLSSPSFPGGSLNTSVAASSPEVPSLSHEIFTSANKQTSSGAKEMEVDVELPRITESELTEEQQDIMKDVMKRFGFHTKLVLKAFEECKNPTKYDIQNWCNGNNEKYDFEDEVQDDEDYSDKEDYMKSDTSSMDSDDDETYNCQQEDKPAPAMNASTPMSSSRTSTSAMQSGIRQIEAQPQLPIDRKNPTVHQLCSAGFSEEQSMEAVERYNTLEAAMEYLMSLEDDDDNVGGVFYSGVPTRQDSSSFGRQSSGGIRYIEPLDPKYSESEPTILCDSSAEKGYLSLEELGHVLTSLIGALPSQVPKERSFNTRILKCGHPNLIVTPPDNVLRTVLALFMEDEDLPLPTLEEILICNQTTTAEEVTLLWQRAIGDPDFKRIFCLVHAERLTYQVSDKALRSLSDLSQGKRDYRLVIICSNEEEEKSHIISKLHSCRRPFPLMLDSEQCQRYLKAHFIDQTESDASSQSQPATASKVDHETSCVRLVTSKRSGMGKSLFIQRMAQQLQMNVRNTGKVCITVPLHGPKVTPDVVMDYLEKYMLESACTIFHLDIAPTILSEVDTILFSLLVLCGLIDSQGRVWRCHPGQLYAVELTLPEKQEQVSRVGQILALTEILPTVHCVSPRETLQMMDEEGSSNPSVIVMDEQVFAQPICQRVYQYLRRHMGNYNLDSFSYAGNVEGNRKNCLEIFLHNCGIRDPSWSEIRHFIEFLDIQLKSCEESVFCDEMLVGDVMSGLKSFVVKFMIRMSRDFATSSLQGEVARENLEDETDGDEDNIEHYQIASRRCWETNSHPYIFFNDDRASVTFVGFMVTRNGDLMDPSHGGILEAGIMTSQLYTGLKHNRVNFDEDFRQWPKGTMIEKIATVMGIEFPYDPDETYVLTVDNLIKILAIQMRFRCGIPVVIMGETGCGKTRLIRYMCDLARQGENRRNMLIMKVHGGTTEKEIEKFISRAEKEAEENRVKKMDTVVFFDEANTTDAIGLIKEIMCDRRIHGKSISSHLKFIAACNPYRKHSEDMIKRLENAGLGFYVRESDTRQKLGKIPLRQLVYRVLDLPLSMRPLVYDFGQLQQTTEDDYIKQIVRDHVTNHAGLRQESPHYINAVAKVLAWSQDYMRRRKDECSFVSLRDVERAMIVFKYFYEKMDTFAPLISKKQRDDEEDSDVYEIYDEEELRLQLAPRPLPRAIGKITRALILSLSVCYHARLQVRTEYEQGVSRQFVNPLSLPGGDKRFRNEIRWCQEVLLDNMRLGENIAKNAALRENVFMMAICIELRIPLFLVGKPGSSKSLAKAVIHASMRGNSSSSKLLRGFKEVDMFSYQCSQLSTPESVIEVFNTASRFQSKQDTKRCVAVVVLDEVGLAEDSPNLPLKALHPLLEDGTEGASTEGRNDVIIAREERVAFIGISNWALDPAKMNRGVMVTRGDPSEDELEFSAEGICSNKKDDPVKARLKHYFKPLSEAYMEICKKQVREFFGLRDFYSLIKMLYWMCEKSGCPPTWPQLEHAIKRNFGGLESSMLDPMKIFKDLLPCSREPPDLSDFSPDLHAIVSPDCSRFGLIQASLSSKEKTWHGENRYLLFLTENYAALDILKHYLSGMDSSHMLSTADAKQETMEPFVLFGSSFPKDKEYTQVCRNINQIKICMETGRTVILLNLENLYESLYDVLNQYYIYNGGNRYVDLGLQTHRVRCRVHDDFKLILIAEKDTVYQKFPTPLINRLEKHFVLTSSVLEEWQTTLLDEFETWIHKFCETRGKRFARGDAFIGYQKDTPAAVVFQASNFLRRMKEDDAIIESKRQLLDRAGIPMDEDDINEQWKAAVLPLSQFLLLQTAAPAAVIRLETTGLEHRREIKETYFKKLHHQSMEHFLIDQLQRCDSKGGLLIQVTTHSHLLAHDELEQVKRAIETKSRVESCSLHEFETELDFTSKIGPYFKRHEEDSSSVLVVIQCDSGHSNGDLIACARNRIYDIRSEKEADTHVVFVIHLPHQAAHSSFVGFQGDPWVSVHIDDLRPTSDSTIMPYEAMETAISELFIGTIAPTERVGSPMEQGDIIDDDEGDIEMDRPKPSAVHAGDTEGSQIAPWPVDEEERMDEDDVPLDDVVMSEFLGDGHFEGEGERMEEYPTTASLGGDTRPPTQILPPQCQRLHGCIQAAASKLQDDNKRRATQRVEILVNLVPKETPLPFEHSTFHGILVQHVFNVLKQRDEVWEVDKQWVLNEAMDARKLQNGGTFRNVLARKIDDVVVPIFSEIIACIDRNYNLDLINKKNDSPSLRKFWLDIFGRPKIMQFNYIEMKNSREKVPGVGGRRSVKDFKCQLPFSWIIKATIDDQWDNAKSSAGNDRQALHKQLCEGIQQTEISEVLKSVKDGCCEEFYKYYLHDYVRNIHQSQHKEQDEQEEEYNLIATALDEMVHDDEFSSIDGQDVLIKRMAALHVVYMFNRSQLMWFGQLVSQHPSIMRSLKDKQSPDTSEMVLHLFAVERALEVLTPPLEQDKVAEHLLPWLNDLRLSHNAIDTILSLPPCNVIVEKARPKWQLIQAMQMFLEHVLLKHSDVPVPYARRLELYLVSGSDFLKADTLKKVKKHLNQTHKELSKKPKLRSKPKTIASIQRSCREFFMEIVSNLCFGGRKLPEPDLIKMLMNTVFTEKEQESEATSMYTRDMTPYEADPDQVPVIRSFLMQLLLEHNPVQVKEHLRDYFDRSHQAFGRDTDRELSLLCIQCFEDALYKELCGKCFARRVKETTEMLLEGHVALSQLGQYTDSLNLEYLEGVAKVRFALSTVAELLNLSDQPRSQEDGVLVVQLLHQAREVCSDPGINLIDNTGQKDTVGPIVYLIKLLVRQYGLSCLQKASVEHTWIVPDLFRKTEEEEKIVDPFVIYGKVYSHLRLAVSNAAYGKQLPVLVECAKDLGNTETVPLLMALYQKVTLSHASSQPSKQILPDVLEEFNQFILGSKVLPKEMQWMARALITNKHGEPLPLLSVAPHQSAQCRTLTALVVHASAVFLSRQRLEVLWPFISILSDPARLTNSYLPTMEEDHLQEARAALGGAFYSCPRGHPYFVGECGRPVQELTCHTCGARIGGISHKLRADNTQARTNDTTQTGHVLGDPNGRTTVPAPERSLSPAAICVLRALMHSAFLWACCNNDQRIGDIVQLIKPHVAVPALPEFFWGHLNKDIELLGRSIGKSYEEAAMTVHLVLKEILTKDPPGTATVGVTNTLVARNAREQWETIFNRHYIQPVVESLEQKVSLAMQTILEDDDQEHDQLYYLVYEHVELMDRSSIQPHLWTFRSRISLEHLAQTLQEKKMKDRHPILYEFLQVEPVLRATQYLPDIVRLQQCLYDAFHHRLDKKDAVTRTIREFLDSLASENARNEYQERIGSLQNAWALVGHMLKNHARLKVKEEYLVPSISLDMNLEYLIPTTTEAGACTTALVDFLVLAHNDFIQKCRNFVSKDERSAAFWKKHEVPITQIHRCHLVDYEHQLLSIVLSHCNYSLTFGKGQSVKYDHKALQKHILDRFIHGKPMILSDIPHVVYRKDIYTTVTFAAVRKKVKTQEQLTPRIKQEIISELRTPDRLRQALDVVEIVLGFLSSGGGKADKPLGEYIDRMLKMKKRPFSSKAREYCCLGHVMSLWETISVELARQLYLTGQEPFDFVDDKFLEPLEADAKDALEKCLRLFDLDCLLGTLYEFIETHVKHSPNEELIWPIKETLEEFLDRNDLPQVQNFYEEFPDNINISQAIAAWKCIVDHQDRVRQQ